MDNEVSQLKPFRVKGTGYYKGKEFTFKPVEAGSPAQLNVKTCKGGKLFQTTSESKPQQVAHLSCPADSPDPWSEYTDKLRLLGIKPLKEQSMPARQRLVAEAGMEVYLAPKTGELVYQGRIDLNATKNWQSEIMRQLQIIVRTLPVEKKFTQLINKIKKGGQKS